MTWLMICLDYSFNVLLPPLFSLYSATSLTAIADSLSFLFTLVNPSGSEAIKITPISGCSGGIRCLRDMGPSFGTDNYYDLQLWSKSGSNLDLGHGFTCPKNVNKTTYFTGKTPFEINEMEVFKVDF